MQEITRVASSSDLEPQSEIFDAGGGAVTRFRARREQGREDNPVTGTLRFADGQRQVRLVDAEYAGLERGMAIVALPKGN